MNGKISSKEELEMNQSENNENEAAAKLAAEAEAKKLADAAALAAVEAKKNDPVEQLREKARQFKAEFGPQAGDWVIEENLSYEQAQKRFADWLKSRVETLEKENAELKAAKPIVSAIAVGVAPVTASATVVETDNSVKTFAQLVDDEVAAFSAKGQKITRTDAMRSVARAHPEAYARTRGGKR
jgi:S-methylmethionine-dependent homocysteine/selenocysteine methylase